MDGGIRRILMRIAHAAVYGVFFGVLIVDHPLDPPALMGDARPAARRALLKVDRDLLRAGDGAQSRYALIVNGDAEPRHLGNVTAYAEHLRRVFGVPRENILVLCSSSCDGPRFEDATRAGFDAAVAALRRRLDGDDVLFVYTTGHGDREGGSTTLALEGEAAISDAQFAEAVLDLPAGKIHYFGDQCYSGAFARIMTSRPERTVAAMSSTGPYSTVSCSAFTPHYLAAFGDPQARETPPKGLCDLDAFQAADRHAREAYKDEEDDPPAPGMYLSSGRIGWMAMLMER